MKMLRPYQKKAAICLASGDTEEDTAQQVNVHVSIIHKWLGEDDFNAYLNGLKRELNPEPERTVLKWRQLDKNNETTYPKYGQIVLAVNNNKEFAVCMFDGIKRKEFVIEERETTIVLNNVYAWMELPNAPIVSHIENDEYLIEQTTLETFDIIDAITPALREAVKHLLVQQGVSK
jgi:hypothetical protein